MPGYFEPVGGGEGGAALALDQVEVSILRSLAVQLLELVGPGEDEGADHDPLAAMFAEGPSEPPADAVLARLFPDGYTGPGEGEDEERRALSAEFRRFTETDLRARKREGCLAMIGALDRLPAEGSGGAAVLTLSPEASEQWLGALNDLRLAIGTRLELTDDSHDELFAMPDGHPDKPMMMAYLWLGGLQESLLETLQP
ncbi:DUF2017 domain-containing protein [Streptomyces sp. ACA25]|uniref:DUF2017 domain-containing protein n=1 Tax=Streptomyces sp. ACA25 TaxID=3022596 RepID=UPI00230783D0|nr:DUF2017 domain-containing protein [Streptomyces sp. ACA25]MDB1089515.1 DUF2017 domain-containing protein [Streptomyces sp. ACA25]